MPGTFSSFQTAVSAMRYNRVAMDVASGNIANAGTDGYVRRQVVGQATGAPSVPAIWSRWDGAGDGVEPSTVMRLSDALLDARSRSENAASSYLDTRQTSLVRFETALAEPGDGGVAAALTNFQQAWHDVANNPGDPAAGTQLLARAATLRDTIATQAAAVANEWSDQRVRLDALGTQVNEAAAQLADLNKGLRAANLSGTDAGTLLDQRDQLTLTLAKLTGATVTVNDDTTVDVKVAGQALVTGNTAGTVSVTGSTTLAGAGSSPVGFSVNGTAVTLSAGAVGGTQQLLGSDLPGYLGQLDSFVATMATAVNTQHQAGVTSAGVPGGAFFTGTTALTLQVAVTGPAQLAGADATKGGYDNGNATKLASLDIGGDSYRNLVTRFGVQVSSAKVLANNQAVLTAQVDASREAVSGISIDEEMVNLLAAQRGFEGASRVLTTIDSVLDTLINRTGLTH